MTVCEGVAQFAATAAPTVTVGDSVHPLTVTASISPAMSVPISVKATMPMVPTLMPTVVPMMEARAAPDATNLGAAVRDWLPQVHGGCFRSSAARASGCASNRQAARSGP